MLSVPHSRITFIVPAGSAWTFNVTHRNSPVEMIARYRNQGVVFAVLALAATVLFFVAVAKTMRYRDEWRPYQIPLYLCAAVLWSMASYSLAKAKGYGPDELGKVLMLSLLLGFCCQPLALIFPLLGFALKDRHRPHRRRRRSGESRGTREDT